MKKLLIFLLTLFVLIDILLILVIFFPSIFPFSQQQKTQKISVSSEKSKVNKKTCQDFKLDGSTMNCYSMFSKDPNNPTGKDLLYLMASVDSVSKDQNRVFLKGSIEYFSNAQSEKFTQVFELSRFLGLCKLNGINLQSGGSCELAGDKVFREILQNKIVLLELAVNHPDEKQSEGLKTCKNVTKNFIETFAIAKTSQELQQFSNQPCYPIVSSIYYY